MSGTIQNYHEKYDCFYQSGEWKALRKKKFRQAFGLCERCRAKGIVKAGTEVHHVESIEKNWERRLDFDNLILLCHDCHGEKHGRDSALQKFNRFWEGM